MKARVSDTKLNPDTTTRTFPLFLSVQIQTALTLTLLPPSTPTDMEPKLGTTGLVLHTKQQDKSLVPTPPSVVMARFHRCSPRPPPTTCVKQKRAPEVAPPLRSPRPVGSGPETKQENSLRRFLHRTGLYNPRLTPLTLNTHRHTHIHTHTYTHTHTHTHTWTTLTLEHSAPPPKKKHILRPHHHEKPLRVARR